MRDCSLSLSQGGNARWRMENYGALSLEDESIEIDIAPGEANLDSIHLRAG